MHERRHLPTLTLGLVCSDVAQYFILGPMENKFCQPMFAFNGGSGKLSEKKSSGPGLPTKNLPNRG